jgi:hypothetical protein
LRVLFSTGSETIRLNTESSPQEVTVAARDARLLLLAVDPYQIHAYWEVDPGKLDVAKTQAGEGAHAVLRFYDVARMGNWFDVEIQSESRNWYVQLWTPGRSYSAELGFRSVENQFVRVVQSNIVHMPRAWPVVAVEERFAYVEPPPRPRPAPEPAPADAVVVPPAATRFDETRAAIPPVPKPVDSIEQLQTKLTEIRNSAQVRTEPSKDKAPLLPPVGPFQKETGLDLTAEAEKAFINLPSSSQ